MENLDLAKVILDVTGGKENISSAQHCMTRLRLKIKDESKVDQEALKNTDGVLGVVQSDTLQIVIGPGRVKKIYDIFVDDLGVARGGEASWEENKDAMKAGQKQSPFKAALKTISNIFIPMIPAIIAAGLFNGFASLIGQFFLDAETTTGFWYILKTLFSLIGTGFLGYFAIYTGINAAREFRGTEALGGMIGAMSIATPLIALSTTLGLYNADQPLESILTTGKGGIIGVIIGVWIMSKIERAIRKVVPDVLDLIVTPFLTLLISGAIFVLGIMPIAGFLSDWLVVALNVLINSPNPIVSVISGFVLAAVFLPMVLLGLHHGLIPIYAIQLETLGGVTLFPVLAMAGAGQVGAAIAIYFKAKKAGNTSLTKIITGALPAGFLGVGEPLIYGVTLPLGKPFITAGLGAGFGGAYVMLMKVMAVAWGPSGLVAIPLMKTSAMMLHFFIGLVIAYVAGFIITSVIMKPKDVVQN
ncbi:PTS transporter subunit EIIC [Erysipelothrix sp. HDW6C]|uniref:PTS transporter subunit EIIC n=1 Tax=Erysipelothrix sp. HDW6C TaxID=2714930 RepID=UPI00140A56B8|nr:PTS transporter subunit EIIC [Erysipelothrix sp. HDW6C]QIK68945.1 PTS transporter subunit EIIC [Erysipelothrix sp. HDW6C]